MAVKNLHLEHLEDEIINQGIDGGRQSLYFLLGLRDMMKGRANSRVNMTVKWDGAPAIWAGKHPETNQFFVAKKSLFNKTPLYYSSEQQIKDATELSGDLESKFLESFKYLSKLSFKNILQGDLMFTSSDKKTKKIDGENYITFQPNTILYAVQADSDLGKKVSSAKLGIVFHTTYTGGSLEDLGASFGANIKGLGHSSDVWVDDATFKDVHGNSSMTAKETLALTRALTAAGKAFHGIKKKDLDKFNAVQKEFNNKGAAGASYKTYTNALIRGGSFHPNAKDYLKHAEVYWDEKVIAKLKRIQTRATKEEIKTQLLRELRSIDKMINNLATFQDKLVAAKQIIVTALNRVKSIGTFKKTDKGFEVVSPEGYVAIDNDGKAVKLVDRMEFSANNFNAAKSWDK